MTFSIDEIKETEEYKNLDKKTQRDVLGGWFGDNLVSTPEFQGLDYEDRVKVFSEFLTEQDPSSTEDLGRSFASGLDQVGQMIGRGLDVVGLDTIGQSIETFYKKRQEEQESNMSFEFLQEKEKPMLARDDEGKLTFGIGPGAKSPMKIAGTIAESLPAMGVGAGGGAGLTASLLKMFPKLSPKIAGIIGAGAGEGAVGGAFSAKDIYDKIIEAPEETITETDEYQRALTETGDPMEARRQLAKDAALKSFLVVGSTTATLGAWSGAAYGKLLKEGAEGGFIKTMGKQGLLESIQEGPQSAVEQFYGNLQTQQYVDPKQDPMENVAEAAATGVVVGGVMGAGMGGAGKMISPIKPDVPDVPTAEIPEVVKQENADVLQKLRVDLANNNLSVEDAETYASELLEIDAELGTAANQIVGEAYGNQLEAEIRRQRAAAGNQIKQPQKDPQPQFGGQELREQNQVLISQYEAEQNRMEQAAAQERLEKSQFAQQKATELVNVIQTSESNADILTAGTELAKLKEQMELEGAVESERKKKEELRKFRYSVAGRTPAERRVEAQRKLNEAQRLGIKLNPELEMELREIANPGSEIEWTQTGVYSEPAIQKLQEPNWDEIEAQIESSPESKPPNMRDDLWAKKQEQKKLDEYWKRVKEKENLDWESEDAKVAAAQKAPPSILRALTNNTGSAQIGTDVYNFALSAYESGARTIKTFTQKLQEQFGGVWKNIKRLASDLFYAAKRALNNQRGSVSVTGIKTPKTERLVQKTEKDVRGQAPKQAQQQVPKQVTTAPKPKEDLFKKYFGKTKAEVADIRAAARAVTKTGQAIERVPLNVARLAVSEEAKDVLAAATGKSETITWEETEARAKKILQSPRSLKASKKLLKYIAGGRLSAAVTAARTVVTVDAELKAAFHKQMELAQSGKIPFSEAILSAVNTISDVENFVTVRDAVSETTRTMNVLKMEVGPFFAIEALEKIKQSGKEPNQRIKDLIIEKMKKLADGTLTKQDLNEINEVTENPKISDYLLEYWYNCILSGLPTHLVNITSNTLWSLFQIPHKMLLTGVDKAITTFTGKERSHFLNEVVPMLAGYKTGFIRGKAMAGQMFRTGKISSFEDKWTREMGYFKSAFERSPNKFFRKIAPYLTIPTKALRAMDVWANAISFDGAVRSMAMAEANKSGLKGKELAAKEKQVLESWSKELPKEVFDSAMKQAQYSTFTDAPDPLTAAIISIRNKPGAAWTKLFIPFVNTISNLMKRGIEMTPVLGIGKEYMSRKMGRGQTKEQVIAKQIEGAILSMVILSVAAAGNISGPMPDDPEERKQWYREGKKAWAIKLGDTWFEYRRIEPFNTVMAMAASFYDKMYDAPDDKTLSEKFLEFVNQVKWNILDGSYFSGLQAVLNRHDSGTAAIPRFAAGWVPFSSFFRSINRAMEVAIEGEAKPREGKEVEFLGLTIPKEWTQAFSQVIPGLSGSMPARLTLWGEDAVIPGNIFRQWLPYKWSEQINDPVEEQLERLDFYPDLPNNSIKMAGKEYVLSEEDYKNYAIEFGSTLKPRLLRLVTMKNWDGIAPDVQKRILNRARTKVGNQVRAQMKRRILTKQITPKEINDTKFVVEE